MACRLCQWHPLLCAGLLLCVCHTLFISLKSSFLGSCSSGEGSFQVVFLVLRFVKMDMYFYAMNIKILTASLAQCYAVTVTVSPLPLSSPTLQFIK